MKVSTNKSIGGYVVLNKLKKLSLHETLIIDSECVVRRVPGGLLYITTIDINVTSVSVTSTFVRFS